jgi:hypothetical protein
MGFLKGTIDDVLTLEVDGMQMMSWYLDAASAVHADMKSHTCTVFTMGVKEQLFPTGSSRK